MDLLARIPFWRFYNRGNCTSYSRRAVEYVTDVMSAVEWS